MKLTVKLYLLIIFSSNTIYAQDWVKTNITEFATINLPAESELIETQGKTVYTAEGEFGYYLVSITKLTGQQSLQITQKDLPTIYQGVAQGAMDATNGELVSKKNILIQKIPALEIEFTATSNLALPSQRFKRIIYLNQTIVTMDFWPLVKENDLVREKKLKYFDSFTIDSIEASGVTTIPNNQNNNSNSGYETGYETGFIVGQIVFYVILFALLLGIILYLLRKNKKNKIKVDNKVEPRIQITKTICQNCNSENKSDTKYCSSCGYELTNS